MQGLEHLDELIAQAILERHALAVDPARHEQDFLVLDVDALDRPDAVGEFEDLSAREGRGREPAAVLLPDDRWIEALLDGGPDREARREVVAADDQVGTVAHAELVDLREQVVGGIAGEDVRQARLDADAAQGEQATRLPRGGLIELLVTELDEGVAVGSLRMRLRQAHGRIEVVGPGIERAIEDRHVEPWIDDVEHVRDAVLAAQRRDRCLV